jgi:glutamyl-tRNA synthetase
MADFFFSDGRLDYGLDTLLGKKYGDDTAAARHALQQALSAAEAAETWSHEALEASIRPLAGELGVKAGELFGLVRVAVTGKTAAPPLFETMEVLGREKTLERMRYAVEQLE